MALKLVMPKKKKEPEKGLTGWGVEHPGEQENGSYRWKPLLGTFTNMAPNFMTVDPGLGGTGWAVWDGDKFADLVPPIASGVVARHGEGPWWWRAAYMSEEVLQLCWKHHVAIGYMEEPEFMQSFVGGIAARKGDLVKLTATFGMIAGCAFNNHIRPIVPVPIPMWKGNMKDDLVTRRIVKHLPDYNPSSKTSHETDAIGIGLFIKGFFGDNT